MTVRCVLTGACTLLLTGVIPSQVPEALTPAESTVALTNTVGQRIAPPTSDWPNPVPTRIESVYYGHRENRDPPIRVECSPYGAEFSCVRVTGGTPGAGMVLFCAEAPDSILTSFGTFLVTPGCVTLPGVFDANGIFEYPVNLGRRQLCEHSFFLQAMEVSNKEPGMILSWGLEVRFNEGNAQPPTLEHRSPTMQAMLCRTVLEGVPILHTVLIRFEAADSYVLNVEGVLTFPTEDTTRIYVSLASPGGPWGANRWHRTAVDVGKGSASSYVEVWVSLDHGGGAPYRLAAVVETGYCS